MESYNMGEPQINQEEFEEHQPPLTYLDPDFYANPTSEK